jgi:hypothetical protein
MQNVHIDRYPADHSSFAGHISGTNDTGKRWIMWLDGDGTPVVFFSHWDEDDMVHDPHDLKPVDAPAVDGEPE